MMMNNPILIVCALKLEADAIIKALSLKLTLSSPIIRLYQWVNFDLIIWGSWKNCISSSLWYYLALNSNLSYIINIWLCGGQTPWNIYIINQIKDQDYNTSFYPDVQIKHKFQESSIISIWSPKIGEYFPTLIDLEASSIFRIWVKYLTTDRLLFIKITSDKNDCAFLNKDLCTLYLTNHIDSMVQLLRSLKQDPPPDNQIANFSNQLNLTQTQSNEFSNLVQCLSIQKDTPISTILSQIQITSSKAENKTLLSNLKNQLDAI